MLARLAPSTVGDRLVIGVPLTEICNATYTDARERQLFKNIIYVGALAALLDIDVAEVEKLIGEQYRGKEKLLEPNIRALHLGRDYARDNLPCPLGITVRRSDRVGRKIFIEGNNATALGAVYGGATVCAWYPITPSSSVAEAFSKHCRKLRVDAATGKTRSPVSTSTWCSATKFSTAKQGCWHSIYSIPPGYSAISFWSTERSNRYCTSVRDGIASVG